MQTARALGRAGAKCRAEEQGLFRCPGGWWCLKSAFFCRVVTEPAICIFRDPTICIFTIQPFAFAQWIVSLDGVEELFRFTTLLG